MNACDYDGRHHGILNARKKHNDAADGYTRILRLSIRCLGRRYATQSSD